MRPRRTRLRPSSSTAFEQRAERVLQGLEERQITGLAAMDELAVLAAEKEQAQREASESGLSESGFAITGACEPTMRSRAPRPAR
jgi:hypothetical protein